LNDSGGTQYTFLNSVPFVANAWSANTWHEWHVYTDSGTCYVEIDGSPVVNAPFSGGVTDFTSVIYTWGGTATDYFVDDLIQTASTPPPPPDPSDFSGATSTMDQTQQNLFNMSYVFLICMFGMIWLMRKH